ncbi:metallophosphoesterase family protein [Chitinophaga varians]|uniref:metallophosphoesterase family protein n=1 Tax=Chitinophaga varians TaxID=2202339 RepID=UPI0016600352|nr:metallophosphoesterase [Chitinophaga varians]MBC9913831.1 metallophosphoesterase [Chitinophaga varians]
MKRRHFLRNTSLSLAAGLGTPLLTSAMPPLPGKDTFTPIRFGIISDLHQDFTHDAPARLEAFISDMQQLKPDMIIQLGDFCQPKQENKAIMDIWDRFNGPAYHVVGNHETDGGFTPADAAKYWKIPNTYYSFDLKGYHFIVLDGNDTNPAHQPKWKYERFIGEEQLQWLAKDLDSTSLPVIVFCHQGFDNDNAVENAAQVRLLFEHVNKKAGFRKVQMAFSGHFHQDYYNCINDVHHVQINSATYFWRGTRYMDEPFDAAIHKQYPLMKYMSFYRDPLWALVEIHADGTTKITGRSSSFIGKTPTALGMPENDWTYPAVPYISNRTIKLSKRSS